MQPGLSRIRIAGRRYAVSLLTDAAPAPNDDFADAERWTSTLRMLGPRTKGKVFGEVPPNIIQQADKTNQTLWLWGLITYYDTFDDKVAHTTRFCFRHVTDHAPFFEGPHNHCT
jgi:hypothetical protein